MSTRAAAVAFAIAAALLLALACEVRGQGGGPEGELGLELELQWASAQKGQRLGRGGPISFVLTLRNPADEPRRLAFSSAKTHDVVVSRADGREVWRLSQGLFYAQILTEIVIPPGGSQAFPATWEVPADLEPGAYRARGLLTTRPTPLEASPLAFTLE